MLDKIEKWVDKDQIIKEKYKLQRELFKEMLHWWHNVDRLCCKICEYSKVLSDLLKKDL